MTVFLNAEEQREIEATSHRLKSITRRSLRWIATWQGHQSLQEGPINSVNDAEHSRVCASPGTRTKQHVIAEQDDDTLTAHVVRLKQNLEKELLACQEQAASLESQIEALQKEQEGQVYHSNEADSVPRFQESLSSEDDRDATPDRDPNPPATTAIRDREEVVIRGFVLKRTLHAVAPETLALNEVYCEEIMYANMWQEGLQCFRALELALEPIVCRTHEDVHRPMSASSIYFLYRSGETGVAAWLHGLHLSEYIPCFTLAGLTTLEHLVHVEESTLLHTVGMLRGHVRLVLAARERLREVLIENPQVIAPRIRIDEILREIRTCMHELPHQDTLPKVVKLPKRKATSETTQHACASGTTYSTVLPGAHPIKENLESIVETRRRGSACSSGKFGQVLGQDGLWRYPERKLYARRNQVKNE